MSGSDFNNPLRKFKLVFLGEQSGAVLPVSLSRVTFLTCLLHQFVLGCV